MKRFSDALVVVALLLCSLSLLVFVSCEGDESEDIPTSVSMPKISPESANMSAANATSIVFSVSGGQPGYSWKVSTGIGSVIGSGHTGVYTSTTNKGANIVTVSDANGNTSEAGIIQY